MILTIKHRGLRVFWERGESRRLNQDWIRRIERIMNALDLAQKPDDLNFPGWRMHLLKGDYVGYYSVRVSGNWRIVFRFESADITDIDLIDYH